MEAPSSPEQTSSRRLNAVQIFLLFVTCAVASNLFTSISEIGNLNWPTFHGAVPVLAPIWAPFLALVIWFNGICNGNGRFTFRLAPPIIWFLVLIATMGVLEPIHALANDQPTNTELILRFAWTCLVWIALHSFSSSEDYMPATIAGLALFSAVIAILVATIPVNSLLSTGLPNFIQSSKRPEVSIVNTASYQFALAALLSLSAIIIRPLKFLPRWAWAALFLINSLGIFATKSRGGYLVFVVGLFFVLFAAPNLSRRGKFLALTLALIGAASLLAMPQGLSRFEAVVTAGRGFADEGRDDASAPIKWENTSIGVRFDLGLKALKKFGEHPLIGIGASQAAQIQSKSYLIHGVPLIMIPAYGLVGALVAGIFLVSLWKSGSTFRPESKLAFGVCCAATLASQDLSLYTALFISIAAATPQNCNSQ